MGTSKNSNFRHSREGGNPEVTDLSSVSKCLDSRLRGNDELIEVPFNVVICCAAWRDWRRRDDAWYAPYLEFPARFSGRFPARVRRA